MNTVKIEVTYTHSKEVGRYTHQDAIDYLNNLKASGYFEERYEVKTPIGAAGGILFNNRCSVLSMLDGLQVSSTKHPMHDYRDKFQWISCKREDLKPGDTAYGSSYAVPSFDEPTHVCKVIDKDREYYISNAGSIINSFNSKFTHWFKLVAKEI